MIEDEMKRKKGAPPDIRTLDKKTQVIYNWSGAYDMEDGSVHLGCEEKYTATIIWHEVIHMVLFEQFYFEATRMWDNIANDIQEYLFEQCPPEKPFNLTLPAVKAVEIDDGWRLGRKQREKSERVGWKPSTSKRVPIRHIDDIYQNMGL